jgi:glutamate dehydrogenase
MRQAKLLAAFDHRHVFLDPDPDPEIALAERQRLFALDRSSWEDYAPSAFSAGGGVWPRGAKSVPIPVSLRDRLGLGERASGQQLVRSILGLDVDILWNGGIGTYVKASSEGNADVGDRANDAVRIDASELRARVVGEGGNLGLTQAARVEVATRGVRLDTDAIHNSAGVDLSDHEVNYKIALASLVRSGSLTPEDRHVLLFEAVDEACGNVLAHNREQALCISLDELRSQQDPDSFSHAIETLCEHAGLAASELHLPDAEGLRVRAAEGLGLTRPELAVVLGLAKLQAQATLLESGFADCSYLDPLYRSYFPARFREDLAEALDGHRLRREISSLYVVNRLVDAGGAALFSSLQAELGADVSTVASAMLLAEDVLRVQAVRDRLVAETRGSRAGVYAALVELDDGVRMVARFLVKAGMASLEVERAERWRGALDVLFEALRDFLAPDEIPRLEERRARFVEQGLPEDLADRLACLPLADRGLNILRIIESGPVAPVDAAGVYTRLGEGAGFNWMYERLGFEHGGSRWDRMALADLRYELLDLQRDLTAHVLKGGEDDPDAALGRFLAEREAEIARIRTLQQSAVAVVAAEPSALSVIANRFHSLRLDRR